MTPDRLSEVIEHCFRVRRKQDLTAFYRDIARFLGVEPITLRRWLTGETPIPRAVEVLFEVFAHWPEVTAERIDAAVREAAQPVDNPVKKATW